MALEEHEKAQKTRHVQIVVAEGKVTLQDLHKALDQAVTHVVRGGCNCGLTGFDLSFVRGDPGLAELTKIPNIQAGIFTR
jgi:hypothetical protein